MTVLLVEDDPDLASTVIEYLEPCGFVVDHAFHAGGAFQLVEKHSYDLVILDVMLPRTSGFEICERLRSYYSFQGPILFLTAMDTLENKLKGFRVGCDDYLVKPFELPELECRLRALTKRGSRIDDSCIQFGELTLYPQERRVTREGKEINLNKNQFNVLIELIRQAPNPVTRDKLSEIIWLDEAPESDSLRSHIYRLRNQIDKPFSSDMIETVHGVGLRIRHDNKIVP